MFVLILSIKIILYSCITRIIEALITEIILFVYFYFIIICTHRIQSLLFDCFSFFLLQIYRTIIVFLNLRVSCLCDSKIIFFFESLIIKLLWLWKIILVILIFIFQIFYQFLLHIFWYFLLVLCQWIFWLLKISWRTFFYNVDFFGIQWVNAIINFVYFLIWNFFIIICLK